jgi:prophage regulatory protein
MATLILRLPDVKKRTGLSRSTIYSRVDERSFPQPISLGGRAVGWIEAEINEWLSQRIAESRSGRHLPDGAVKESQLSLLPEGA